MDSAALERSLIQAMEQFEIVDCHEHLGPESDRLALPVDVFTLFSHYTHYDLIVAGMSEAEYQSLYNQDIPLQRRWATFAPYWRQTRWTSYARAALIAAKRFYGIEDINEHTYVALSEAMRAANTAGIYQRVLGEACRIRVALTQCGSTELGGCPLLVPLVPAYHVPVDWLSLSRPSFARDEETATLDEYVACLRRYLARSKAEGAVGVKMMSNPFGAPDRREAVAAFEGLRAGTQPRLPAQNPIYDYVADEAIKAATELGLVVAVHTGYWGDFRQLDPLHMIPVLQRHPKARFDVYHLGYPWMRETIMLAKGFGNVWLNLAWTHVISQRFATAGLDEAIDAVPANKILAFGGDYRIPVEKVYGHLVMAREDIASVLARRIADGQMNEEQALDLAHRWFWDNPVALYQLNL